MDSSCSLANSAIIQGMFKYNEMFKACELFEKARVNKIKLSVGAYNAYLSNSHILAGKEPISVFIKQVLHEMSQRNVIPNLGTLNAILESLDKSSNFVDKPRLAMQVLGEFENLGIWPSLGSYGIFFSIIGKSNDRDGFYLSIMTNIMNFIHKKEHEILHPSDLNFFVNSIMTFYENKSNLVMVLHEMLLKNNNTKFITTNFHRNNYYQKLYHYVFNRKPIDFAMEIYRRHFNTVSPNTGTVKVILRTIIRNSSSKYFVEIWNDLNKLHFNKNRAVLRQVIYYVENCTDQSLLNIVYQAAITFLEKSAPEDILMEDNKTVSCLFMTFVKNDDEKRLLTVIKKFEETSHFLNLEDSAWKIIFDYAMSKKNVSLIRDLLTLASEAKYPNIAKMTEEALPILKEQDAAWVREFIKKTKV